MMVVYCWRIDCTPISSGFADDEHHNHLLGSPSRVRYYKELSMLREQLYQQAAERDQS